MAEKETKVVVVASAEIETKVVVSAAVGKAVVADLARAEIETKAVPGAELRVVEDLAASPGLEAGSDRNRVGVTILVRALRPLAASGTANLVPTSTQP